MPTTTKKARRNRGLDWAFQLCAAATHTLSFAGTVLSGANRRKRSPGWVSCSPAHFARARADIYFILLLASPFFFSLPPSCNSDQGSHRRVFSPPPHYSSCQPVQNTKPVAIRSKTHEKVSFHFLGSSWRTRN